MPTGDDAAVLGVALGEHYSAFVARKVEAGRYQDAAAVLRAALDLLELSEAEDLGLSDAAIRALVAEGEASGIVEEEPGAFFERLRAHYVSKAPGPDERRDG